MRSTEISEKTEKAVLLSNLSDITGGVPSESFRGHDFTIVRVSSIASFTHALGSKPGRTDDPRLSSANPDGQTVGHPSQQCWLPQERSCPLRSVQADELNCDSVPKPGSEEQKY